MISKPCDYNLKRVTCVNVKLEDRNEILNHKSADVRSSATCILHAHYILFCSPHYNSNDIVVDSKAHTDIGMTGGPVEFITLSSVLLIFGGSVEILHIHIDTLKRFRTYGLNLLAKTALLSISVRHCCSVEYRFQNLPST